MDMLTLARATAFVAGPAHPARRRLELTTNEFLQLGMFRLAYLAEDGASIAIRGADGLPITTVESAEGAQDMANQLGLILVPVH